jgi:tetratricopeptide (TPR) repeat protein
VKATASIQLVEVVGLFLARIPEAQMWARRAKAVLANMGGDELLSARLLNCMASIAKRQGRQEESLGLLRQALATFERVLGRNSPEALRTRCSIGWVLARLQRLDEARAYLEETLVLGKAALGADHLDVGAIHNALGGVFEELGRHEESLAHFRRSLAIEEAVLGTDHPKGTTPLVNVGLELLQLKRFNEAVPLFRRALALDEKALGANHPDLAYELTWLGKAELGLNAPAEALPLLKRALALREREKGDPTMLAETQFTLAQTLWELNSDRPRAKALAANARAAYVADGQGSQQQLADVDAWLAAHGR